MHTLAERTDMNSDWYDLTVLVNTSDVTGLIIATENSTPASPPFGTLNESSTMELYIPTYRIKHVARGRFTGIS